MLIAIVSTHIHWPTHFETELELMQLHIDAGDRIDHLVCNADLPICDINTLHVLKTCLLCINKRKEGLKLLTDKVNEVSLVNFRAIAKQEISSMKKTFSSIEDLKNYKIENFDIGYAVASSLISTTRDPNPDLKLLARDIEDCLCSALAVFRSTLDYLRKNQPDRVYVFNGRFAHVKAILRACQQYGTDCYVHERGHNFKHYSLFLNTTPHDLTYIERKIREAWENAASISEKNEIGAKFYQSRAQGLSQSWFSFTKDQEKGKLPSTWDNNKRNIVIFNSSEDEFASIGEEWRNKLFTSQLDGLKKIISYIDTIDPNIQFYLRIHPNLKNVNNSDVKTLFDLSSDRFTIIPPDSTVDSYQLLKHSEKVITFGSTMGMEAVFWGRPSILIGMCYYRNLGGTYNPDNLNELLKLINAQLVSKSKESALMYGYYMNSFGIPFKYYCDEGIMDGNFKGQYFGTFLKGKYRVINLILKQPPIKMMNPNVNLLHRKFVKNKY